MRKAKKILVILITTMILATMMPATVIAQPVFSNPDVNYHYIKGTLPIYLEKTGTFSKPKSYKIPQKIGNHSQSVADEIIKEYERNGGFLDFKSDLKYLPGKYCELTVRCVSPQVLSHLGNVVNTTRISYYASYSDYVDNHNPTKCMSKRVFRAYAGGIAYFNTEGNLVESKFIPRDSLSSLKDEDKIPINRDWNGDIMILLCTKDSILGWTPLAGLYQYQDGTGSMEYPCPEKVSLAKDYQITPWIEPQF